MMATKSSRTRPSTNSNTVFHGMPRAASGGRGGILPKATIVMPLFGET